MLPITNEKVAGLEPHWAKFHGFTLLFDNPGTSLKTIHSIAYLDCDVDAAPDLALYKAFRDGLQRIGLKFLTRPDWHIRFDFAKIEKWGECLHCRVA